MKQNIENPENIEQLILNFFPDAEAIIQYGSFGKDYIQGISDIDVVVIGSDLDVSIIDTRFRELHNIRPEIDPVYITQDNIRNSTFIGRGLGRNYTLHLFDLFRLKTQGQLLFGNAQILEQFPVVTLDEALHDTLPHIKDVFLPKLREELESLSDDFIHHNLDILLVLIRAVFTIENGRYGSKIAALDYLGIQHPELLNLANVVKSMYLKESDASYLNIIDIKILLDLTEFVIDKYQQY